MDIRHSGIRIFIENIQHFHLTKENEVILLTSLREIIKDIENREAPAVLMFEQIDIAISQRK